jgi:ectoine hydroxylase-related dioxygenase (phytanoyl-CoA dioxygenase family)
MNMHEFDVEMTDKGWAVFQSVVPTGMVNHMLNAIHQAYMDCRDIQVRNGVADGTENTVHHLPTFTRQRVWIDYLESMVVAPYLEHAFGGRFVLNSMGGNLNPPSTANYASAIHRDIRSWTQDRLMINTLVMLDPFTEKNGATWLLPGSHTMHDKPDEKHFDSRAEQIIAPAGSVLVFDARVWHRAGVNRSNKMRRIITPIFTKPFFRPEYDYPRAVGGGDGSQYSESLRQVLGFNSRVPAKLTEFYQPKETRWYKPNQG